MECPKCGYEMHEQNESPEMESMEEQSKESALMEIADLVNSKLNERMGSKPAMVEIGIAELEPMKKGKK